MKLGFNPSGDSSTKLEYQVPVTTSFINQDASDQLGSTSGSAITLEQALDLFNVNILNTKLSRLLDVDDLLDNAPVGSVFSVGSNGEWTYDSLAEYILPVATSTVLGGVKIGSNINSSVDGTISIEDQYNYWRISSGSSSIDLINKGILNIIAGDNISVLLGTNSMTISSIFEESDPVFSAWDKSSGISITKSQVSDFGTYLTSELDPVFVSSPAYNITGSMIAQWNAYTAYTHPTQSAINPTLSGANVLSSISVNTLGHTISISTRELLLSDLGLDTSDLVHISGSESIFGSKSFLADSTSFVKINVNDTTSDIAIRAQSNFVGIQGVGTDLTTGYGIVGYAYNIPIAAVTYDITSTGIKRCLTLEGDAAHTTVTDGYGLSLDWYMPNLVNSINKHAGYISCIWSDVTASSESSKIEIFTQKSGAITKQAEFDSLGNLTLTGSIYADNLRNSAYSINFTTASSSVAARCSGVVEGTDYPLGWILSADSNPNDLLITHNLDRPIASVNIFAEDVLGRRLLIGNAAFSGVVAPNSNTLRIEALATVEKPISIELFFS